MGMLRLLQRDSSTANEGASHNTTAQIAIGAVVPVVVLLGGLVLFIWMTERRRRAARAEDARKGPTYMRNLLAIFRTPERARIDSLKGMEFGPNELHKDRHELSGSVYVHELADTGRVGMQSISKPLPSTPRRTDSLQPNEFSSTQHSLHEAPARPQRYSVAESLFNANRQPEYRQSYAGSDTQRLSNVEPRRHSTAPPSSSRASLQPNNLFSMRPSQSQHEIRFSKAASSRCSRNGPSPLDSSENIYRNADSSLEGKRSDDLSPPISAIDPSDISRMNSQRLDESERGSGVHRAG